MTTEQQIQIGLSLLTVLSSGVVSATVTYMLNKRREERQLFRKKLEELYLATHKFENLLGGHLLLYLKGIDGKLDLNQVNDCQIEDNKRRGRESSCDDAMMLIAIYFPQLQKEWDDFLKVRDAGSEICATWAQTQREGRPGPHRQLQTAMVAVIDGLVKPSKALKDAIQKTARRLS